MRKAVKILAILLVVVGTAVGGFVLWAMRETGTLVPARGERPVLASGSVDSEVDRLAGLACVWGFLKYHHPRVTGGKVDWDAELLRSIPPIRTAKTRIEYQAAILALIDAAGFTPTRGKKSSVDPAHRINLDLRWLQSNALLDKEVRGRLMPLLEHACPRSQRYIRRTNLTGNPDFKGEDPRPQPTYPAVEVRLLALFRFWNVIEYFSPYKYAIDEDWHGVLRIFIPRLLQAENEMTYHLAIKEFAARTRDGHAAAWSQVLEHGLGS